MAGLLGSYKKGDKLDSYRQGGGLLDVLAETELGQGLLGLATDPVGQTKKAVSTVANKVREANRKNKEAFDSGNNDQIASRALDYSQDALGFAPIGMTVWHGSPHKFDKFDISKIGTGEGAQAYGHGLYVAESKAVGDEYRRVLAGKEDGYAGQIAANAMQRFKEPDRAIDHLESMLTPNVTAEGKAVTQQAIDLIKQGKSSTGNLYKVDIPDEAVARMLDWDKPLSQQAPEVRAAIGNLPTEHLLMNAPPKKMWDFATIKKDPNVFGHQVHSAFEDLFGSREIAGKLLKQQGIPGIRYLDGGSRSAGQGSSNFVLFSDDLPRILEINGQATGNQPWARGEWGLLK